MKVAVFHPGTQHSWQTALALQELERLQFYATTIFYRPDAWPYRLERLPGPVGRALRAEFRRYASPALDPALIRTGGVAEWFERLAARAGWPRLAGRIDAAGNRSFVRTMRRDIVSAEAFALWGYNNSALTSFELAKAHGRTCILDRTIGDWRAYNRDMALIAERYGDWLSGDQKAMDGATIARESAEHALADRIVVGCEFAAATVREFAETPAIASKVEVLEYCYDERLFAALPPPQPRRTGPVRFLFLGLAIPRKGIQHVLEAIAQLPANEASLTIVGKLGVPPEIFARFRDRIDYHPSVPRADVPGIMAAHDVLLFPSYFEGAGLVLYEALATGMALIQSNRASIAVTDDTGILLGEPSTEALLEAMRAAIADRDRLANWRENAQPAARRFAFAGYRERIGHLLERMGL